MPVTTEWSGVSEVIWQNVDRLALHTREDSKKHSGLNLDFCMPLHTQEVP